MLFGEHSVVYGRHCLVAAINERLEIAMKKLEEKKLIIDLDSVHHEIKIDDIDINNLHEIFKFIDAIIFNFNKKYRPASGINIKILKHFSSDYGFGSSAAITASVTKGLFELFEISGDEKEIFDLGLKSILDVQKVGSGFDLAASLLGGVVFFQTGGKEIKKINAKLDFITCYTGIKVNTAKIVLELKGRFADKQALFNNYLDEIEKIVLKAKQELSKENIDLKKIGELMNNNQKILKKIGVSSDRIDKLLDAATKNGAYGGKISGAGVGDCIIVLAPQEKRRETEKSLEKSGGKILNVKIDESGTVIK